jgi:putative Ca2+/H+ antiporter (TMEM165/GDT1 family)
MGHGAFGQLITHEGVRAGLVRLTIHHAAHGSGAACCVACPHHRLIPGVFFMSLSALLPIFLAVFLAELGDKTQLAALGFAATGNHNPWLVFAATALALVASSALAVVIGTFASQHLTALPLKLISGLMFVALGLWSLAEHFRVV